MKGHMDMEWFIGWRSTVAINFFSPQHWAITGK